jgi:hypothetical protein
MALYFDPTPTDREQLVARGITEDEADRQLGCLRRGFAPVPLVRPATLGDGIEVVVAHRADRLIERWSKAAREGRLSRFVPASGAASRMFNLLEQFRADEIDRDPGLDQFFDGRRDFAFAESWEAACREAGVDFDSTAVAERRRLVDILLGDEGLGLARLPKGLVPFHGDGVTAFCEQAAEASEVVADHEGRARVHFTVSPEHRPLIEAHLADSPIEASYSEQLPATDMLAVDEDGQPFRDDSGRLLFRPGGHGALIQNLDLLDADIVLIKNIDNVATGAWREAALLADRQLTGILSQRQDMAHRWWKRLRDDADEVTLNEVALFVRSGLHHGIPEPVLSAGPATRQEWLLGVLARPIRVCGMVRNEGEPGGGPFWVRDDEGGETLQIVESSQIDHADAAQEEQFRGATHFNPVQLVCGLRNPQGTRPSLKDFVDDHACFISSKSYQGRSLRALERPGLWNGAMAGWSTIFVEVPLETFNPVKTVLDLLRTPHRATESPA